MIDKWFSGTFYPITITQSATFPNDDIETEGTSFAGVLSAYSGGEAFIDNKFSSIVDWKIACGVDVTVTEKMKIRYETRYFTVHWAKESYIKPDSHKILYCEEVT